MPPPGSAPLHPAELARLAAEAYRAGPLLLRRLQHFRPYICPFEVLLPWVPPGASVLDVGCGGGLWLRLADATRGLSLGIGFDSSEAAIRLARGNYPPSRLAFTTVAVQQPWPGPPDAPATFDVVSIIDVLHHVPPADQAGLISAAAGRVSPGGLLLYKDMGDRPRWRATANRLHDLLLARQWIHYAPLEQIENAARGAGLRLEHSDRLNRWWYAHDLLVFRRPL